MDNYEISKERACQFFLRFDQNQILEAWDLNYDEEFIYTQFLGGSYRVHRTTGIIEKSENGFQTAEEAGYNEVLSIFDFFCHESEEKRLSGSWAPVNSLKGRPGTIGVDTDFYKKESKIFDVNHEAFRMACEALGGKSVPYGDIGYQFHVFGEMWIILKFYGSDEEFPPQTTILWDENTLQYLFYETTFYVAGFLLRLITEKMFS